MRGSERIQVYVVGFVIGSLIVGFLMARRQAQERSTEQQIEFVVEQARADALEPLPESAPESLREGRVLMFGTLPVDSSSPLEKVWVVGFKKRYPFVRVVQSLANGKLRYMAADQVVVRMREGEDVTALKPVLDALGLRVRMFNRRENLIVVGVVESGLESVPATLKALEEAGARYESVEPDWIQFRNNDQSAQ